MSALANLAIGILFGFGLILSGMADPNKVLNFLDVAGTWDPSLIFVMAAAIAVTIPGYLLIGRRTAPLLDSDFHAPASARPDAPLIVGSAIFGVGWGLVGLCPGPAIVSLALAAQPVLVFTPAMLIGVAAGAALRRRSKSLVAAEA